MTSIYIDPEKIIEEAISKDQYNDVDSNIFIDEIERLKGAALEFARIAIHEVGVRNKYIAGIQKMSQDMLELVNNKSITAHEGARVASELRNQILAESRFLSTKVGKTYAEKIKFTGPSVEHLAEKYSLRKYNKPFSQLTPSERSIIYIDVIKASGRNNPKVTSLLPKLKISANVCILITVGLAIHKAIEAEDHMQEATRQAAQVGGGFAGGYLGTYAGASLAALLCGPGAPLCVVGISFIAGLGGAWLGTEAATQVLDSGEEYREKLEEIEEFLSWEIF